MPRALLFDLDGTMIDSDPIHKAVFRDLWESRGLVMEEGFYETHVHGRLNVDVFAEFLPGEPDPQALSEAKEAEYRRRLPRPYPGTPGLGALLDRAEAAGWPVACVTNAMRLNAEASLSAIGQLHRFEVIIIGEECPRAKPDPYPYAHAMDVLGVAPEACIAFEDSPSGLQSAKAAGAFVIGLRSTLDEAGLRAAGADASIQDYEDPALEAFLAVEAR